MSNLYHEATVHVPMGANREAWQAAWQAAVKARLVQWAARFPEDCPRHGEPTTAQSGWEHCNIYDAPPETRSARLWHRLDPCPVCRLARAGVPPLLQGCSFESFIADTDELLGHLAKARGFAAAPTGFLLLLGSWGNGKSHLAASVLRAFGRGHYFRHLDLVNRLRATYARSSAAADEDEPGIADVCRDSDLLVVDELGVAQGGNDAETMLHDVLDHRVSHYKPTVICANIPAGEFRVEFGDRLADRFRLAAFAVLNFTGPSRRRDGNVAYLAAARARARNGGRSGQPRG